VGDVGNTVLHHHLLTKFSNHPELHSPDLENCAPTQPPPSQRFDTAFHFSCLNYGYYCLYSLISIPLSPYSSQPYSPVD
jgi:hypothetical protein